MGPASMLDDHHKIDQAASLYIVALDSVIHNVLKFFI